MQTLIIYDSFFGNTEKIARAMVTDADIQTVKVCDFHVEQLATVQRLIVGSPTRGFRPTPAITNFLKILSQSQLKSMQVAAFDTRIDLITIKSKVFRWVVKTGGYAAKSIAKQLEKKGGQLIAQPEGFLVVDEKGPFKAGELERAVQWAARLKEQTALPHR